MGEHRILVVDDNHEVRHMVTSWLRTLGSGIEVLDVPSAEEALLITSSLPLDLVVLDHRLPGMTGIEMVSRLQKRKPGIKIILFTGVEDATTRKMVAEADVEAYFYKPIEIPAFLDAVRRCLGQSPITSTTPSKAAKPVPGKTAGKQATKHASADEERSVAEQDGVQGERAGTQALVDCLAALKQQALAISALLVNDAGQILEQVGTAPGITAGSVTLPGLLEVSKASQKVLTSIGKIAYENLTYFTIPRQRIYVAPLAPSYILLLITPDYTELEKLGLIDRVIQMALQEFKYLLEQPAAPVTEAEEVQPQPIELPSEVAIDQATLAGVEDMFSQVRNGSTGQEADGFWDAFKDNESTDATAGGDVLTYDQARDLGLAPEGEQTP